MTILKYRCVINVDEYYMRKKHVANIENVGLNYRILIFLFCIKYKNEFLYYRIYSRTGIVINIPGNKDLRI